MEARVSKLEDIAEEIKTTLVSIQAQLAKIDVRLAGIDVRLAVMDAKLDSKPDQGWIVNVMGIMLGVALASVGAAAGIFALVK